MPIVAATTAGCCAALANSKTTLPCLLRRTETEKLADIKTIMNFGRQDASSLGLQAQMHSGFARAYAAIQSRVRLLACQAVLPGKDVL